MIVSIVGMPAVGKTTTIDEIAHRGYNIGIFKEKYPSSITEVLHKVYNSNCENIRHEIQRIFFEHDIKKTFRILSLIEKHKTVLLDRGLEDTWLVTDFYIKQGILNTEVFKDQYFRKISPFFSNIVIYLFADTEVVKERSKYRDSLSIGPKRNKNDTFIYDLFEKSNFYYSWYHENRICNDIDTTSKSPKEVADEVYKIILTKNKYNTF